jgi:uncharacterized membrane protein YoaT (DUF817 family)
VETYTAISVSVATFSLCQYWIFPRQVDALIDLPISAIIECISWDFVSLISFVVVAEQEHLCSG